MSDAELDQIRKARLAQLQGQSGGHSGGAAGRGQDDDQRRNQEADARAAILAQILLPDAADRLGRIRLVKESRATEVENRLIMLARSGQLRAKVTEEQLKELLEAVAETKEEKIIVKRGGGGRWDEEDDDELFGQ